MRTMQNLVNQDNPNVPAEAPALRAFNLQRGVAFMSVDEPDPQDWVIQHLDRDDDFERVSIWVRALCPAPLGHETPHRAYTFHFCDLVAFCGIVVNPEDEGDSDLGVA